MRSWRAWRSAASQGAFVDISSPYNQVFFSINSILLDSCHWMELRLWSDLYLIQGRYTVIMGTPNKTSSLFVLNGLDVYPSLYGSSPLMSNRIIRLTVGPHFLRSACPKPGCEHSYLSGSCPLEIIPAGYQRILCTFITDPNTPITAPFGGRFL